MNDHCFEHRFSAHSEQAVELFAYAQEQLEDWIYPDEGPEWDADAATLRELVEDEDNLGVITIAFDPELNDNSEACAIYEVYVVRPGGTILDVEYNFTD